MLRIVIAGLLLTVAGRVVAQQAYRVEEVPNPLRTDGTFVFDPANQLGRERPAINALLQDLDDETEAQGAVAYLPSIGDEVPKDFAVDLFERWEIGHAGTDYGFLLLIVADQRRAELETGYGTESIITDFKANRVLEDLFVPLMRTEGPGAATLATLKVFSSELRAALSPELADGAGSQYVPGAQYQQRRPRLTDAGVFVLVVLGLINLCYLLFAGGYARSIVQSHERLYDKWTQAERLIRWYYALFFPLVYFPLVRPLTKRWLDRLRSAPRYHPVTNEPLELLSELDEIDLLESGALVEQEVESAEWDVWTTPDREHVLALRYAQRGSAYRECPKCAYQTYHLDRNRVLVKATTSRRGKRELTYRCKACGYAKVEEQTIARVSSSSSSGGGFSSGGGGGGGGSSFGGGSSGGGGAGASW